MGGGGGGVSRNDISRLTSAAEDRLKQLTQGGTRILFACEEVDRKSLDSHLVRSKGFGGKKYDVTDASQGDVYVSLLEKASLVAVFSSGARQTAFLDQIVELSLKIRKQGVHVKAHENSIIPVKATAYRWPSLTWEKFEEMFI